MPKKNGQPTKAELRHELYQQKINDDNFLIENAELLNWNMINSKYKISTNAIEKCSKYIRWGQLLRNQQVEDEIIKKYNKKIDVRLVVQHQFNITEQTIEELCPTESNWMYGEYWLAVSRRFHKHKLTFDFLTKHQDKLYLGELMHYVPSDYFKKEQLEYINALIVTNKLSN